MIQFVRLADDSWASDAMIAVSRGKYGKTVYAEAIHLPAQGISQLPTSLDVGPEHIRAFRGLEPTLIGYINAQAMDSADPSLNDRDWVTLARSITQR